MPGRHDTTPAGNEPAAEFRERFTRLLKRAPPETFRVHGFAACAPATWTSTAIELAIGDRVTVISGATGDAQPTRISMRAGPHGAIIQGMRRTHSMVASRAGPLEVMLDAPAAIVAIVWRDTALRGLRYLAGTGDVDGLVRDEILRLCNPAQAAGPAPAAGCRAR